MKPGIPWSVKGIDQQAREAAKQAARQSGMTIGEWLNSVILDSAEDGDDLERRFRRGPYRPKAPPSSSGEGDEVNERLEELAEQLQALTGQQSDTAVSRLAAAAGSDAHDQAVVQAILARLDSYEQHTSSALGAMQDRLEQVSERLSRLPDAAPQSPADVPGLPALEGAMRNIIEHIEVSETRTRDAIKALQDRFERMEAYDGGGPGAATVARLEQSVAELSQRMAGTETGAGAEAHQQVQSEIAKLRAEIDSLNQRFDDLHSDAASDRDLHALRATVDELAAAKGPESTAALERQIAGLAERLTASEQRLDHMATIERSVERLVKSFDETRASTDKVAQEAARRAAERVLAERAAAPAQSPELQALQDGLKAVRASAELSDRRAQETFAAVHETLEQIVRKLAELEAGVHQPEAAAETASDPEDVACDETDPPLDGETPSEPDTALAETGEAAVPDDGETEADASAQPDAELAGPETEAASYPSEAEAEDADATGEPAADQPAAQSAPDDAAPQSAEAGEAPVREDYIAAARRAAQMAASRNSGFNRFSQRMSGSGQHESSTTAEGGPKKRGLLGLLRPTRADAAGETTPAGDTGKRKRLILAGLVLLVAAGAYGASRQAGLVPTTDALWPAPADLEQPAAPVSTAPVPQRQRQSDARPLEPTQTAAISVLAADQAGRTVAPPAIRPASLSQAAAAGDATAQFIVASHYLEGEALQRDEAKAAQWFKRAAMQEFAPAQYRLGTLYERGRGVPRDLDAARLWYEEAAGRGNIRAMHNLAVLHADADSGHTNYELAADWFRKAAERGLADSQFNLAVLSAEGIGVPQNQDEALFWFSLSAAQGDKEAAVRARALEATLGSDMVEQTKARLAGWLPLPSDQQANAVKLPDPSWADVSAAGAPQAAVTQPASVTGAELSDTGLIRRAQELLSKHGYDIGEEDGVMSDRTANAVRLFQLQNRLPVNGMVSRELVQALESRRL